MRLYNTKVSELSYVNITLIMHRQVKDKVIKFRVKWSIQFSVKWTILLNITLIMYR